LRKILFLKVLAALVVGFWYLDLGAQQSQILSSDSTAVLGNPFGQSKNKFQKFFNGFVIGDIRIEAGLNNSAITSMRDIYFNRPSYFGNLMLVNHRTDRFSIGAGIGFSSLAYAKSAIDSNEKFVQRIEELYLEPFFNLYFYPKENKDISFYIGPTPSFLLFKTVNRNELYPAIPSPGRDPSKTGRFDLGMRVGMFIKLNQKTNLGAAYQYALTNNQIYHYNTGRASAFQAYLAFNLPLSKEYALFNKERQKPNGDELRYFNTKNMVILVKLSTEHKKIQKLIERGFERDAAELEKKLADENTQTIAAFNNEFNAVPHYFYYDSVDLEKCVANQGLGLMKSNMQWVEGGVNLDNYYLVTFDSPYSETFQTYSGFGLITLDKFKNQMNEPFPFFISNVYGLLTKDEVVSKYSQRLARFIDKYALKF
jgi:hypothetical protein